MWLKWLPWRFIVRKVARQQGFLDPITLLAKFQNFAQPSEIMAPKELLREGMVLHARGLINSQAIQHNLDWVWPFWVECQFDPANDAFVPRAFSLTQINLTHRNWTAVGIPDVDEFPIVDPRGLVTPFYDGWSLDAWIVSEGNILIPSRLPKASQKILMNENIGIITQCHEGALSLTSYSEMVGSKEAAACQIRLNALSKIPDAKAWLVVSVRPYNPEGVSFIHDIACLKEDQGWEINKEQRIYFDTAPDTYRFSHYREGDVFRNLKGPSEEKVSCPVGLCTGAAIFELKPGVQREVALQVPFEKKPPAEKFVFFKPDTSGWNQNLAGRCLLKVPDEKFQFLYEAAVRTLILHSPKEVYPGPYTYRRFWFRDAAFILDAMLSAGLTERVKKVLDCFPNRQTKLGYFLSQDGEWDSNGEALWIMHRFCAVTKTPPPQRWLGAIEKGAAWISRKRLSKDSDSAHAGLFPPGFSAEHLGPNDYYYWDNFWGIAGLSAAGSLEKLYGDYKRGERFIAEAREYYECVERSLAQVRERLKTNAMPAAPYRRLDSGAIGSLAAGYPLQIFSPKDVRLLETVEYLLKNCSYENGFFHDMTHSGINPYLTLHIAQVLLRAEDARYLDLMNAVANLASPTGQWPEAIHPRTKGGCMGDGQHVWAAAEWVLWVRNCFVREEEEQNRVILCAGILQDWLEKGSEIAFGPVHTIYGKMSINIKSTREKIFVGWKADWKDTVPAVEIHLPGYPVVNAAGETNVSFDRRQNLGQEG